jgi:hypothetical protein
MDTGGGAIAAVGDPIIGGGWALNGLAEITGGGEISLTYSEVYTDHQASSVWNLEQIDLAHDFDKSFTIFLGDRETNGADGIVFVLQNVGVSALGLNGGGMGFEGISPSLGVEIDTYDNPENSDPGELWENLDHMDIQINGVVVHDVNPTHLHILESNIEDDSEHVLRVVWDASTTQLSVYLDGN